jgi:hypothetical protein
MGKMRVDGSMEDAYNSADVSASVIRSIVAQERSRRCRSLDQIAMENGGTGGLRRGTVAQRVRNVVRCSREWCIQSGDEPKKSGYDD